MGSKPALVLIVGSGASIPCGISGTADLTKIAMQHLPDAVMPPVGFITQPGGSQITGFPRTVNLGPLLEEALRGTFGVFDFELLLHALEALEAHAVAVGTRSAEYRPVMAAFADILQRYDVLRHDNVLHVARSQVVQALHKTISSECMYPLTVGSQPARSAQEQFIRDLSERFRIIAIDLNYDDLLDRIEIGWEDGFRPSDEHHYSLFDSTAWLGALDGDRHLLLHLHGSVRYGHQNIPDSGAKSMHEPAKYDDPSVASGTFAGRSKSEPSVAGQTVTAFPFISGLDKAAKIVHNVRPFGYYHSAVGMALAHSRRLVVVGYGGRDQHLQSWISEHADVHGEQRKAVAVVLRPGTEVGDYNPLLRMLQILAAKPSMFDFAYAGCGTASSAEGPLLLYPDGAPAAYEHSEHIIEHLSEV